MRGRSRGRGWLRGLRPRLVLGTAGIVAVALGVAFVAVYRGAGAELSQGSRDDLTADLAAFDRAVRVGGAGDGAVLAARRYVGNQPFHATSRLLFAHFADGRLVTNESQLLPAAGSAAGRRAEHALLAAPDGFSERGLPGAGELLVLAENLTLPGGAVVRLGTGESVATRERAQRGVARSLLFAGALALVVAVAFAVALASGLARPLRRMAAVARRVEGGDLSSRMAGARGSPAARGGAEEVRVLAATFDSMLDRLEDAFAGQRDFVADASHELRTPLTVIRGQLEVLARQRDPSPEDVARVEQLVRTEVERMSRLTDDLLMLARAEGTPFLRDGEVALVPWIAELFEGVQATADRRFVLGAVPDVALHADPDRLAQALRNLCLNAIEHTRDGGLVRLTIVVEGGWVTFAVEDDGPGIPVAERPQVFDRFHRVDQARSRRGGGAGLGLAIVRAIAEAHGGSVLAGSSAEGGARMGIRLPLDGAR